MMNKSDCTGNARLLQELSVYESVKDEYGEETALCLTTRAFQRSRPNITRADIESTIKVVVALRTGEISISAEVERAEARAARVVDQLLERLSPLDSVS